MPKLGLWTRDDLQTPPLVPTLLQTCPKCAAPEHCLTYVTAEWHCALCGWTGWTRPALTQAPVSLFSSSLIADEACLVPFPGLATATEVDAAHGGYRSGQIRAR